MDLNAAREVFEASQDLTVGIEEEWAIIDPVTLELVPKYEVFRADADHDDVLAVAVSGELISSEIEIRSGKADSLADATTMYEAEKSDVSVSVSVDRTPGFERTIFGRSIDFYTSRVFGTYPEEGLTMLAEGIAPAIVENVGRMAGMPMGPLALADFIGLDVCLSVMQVLYDGLADSKYRPCPLLVKYVEAGWLGKKTKRGFYDYSTEVPMPTR